MEVLISCLPGVLCGIGVVHPGPVKVLVSSVPDPLSGISMLHPASVNVLISYLLSLL